jgi:hypothetical protein
MAIQIQIRRDTTANWASNNPVLAQGEIGLNLDLNLIKIGDGVSSWNSLQYYSNLTDIQSLTANWQNTFTTVSSSSANWDYQGSDIKALTANWQNTYTTVGTYSASWGAGSATWDSAYTTVNTNSANWDYQGTDIKSLTSVWQDTYTTVNTNSSNWDQTLLFNDITAELTISNGNTVSLSALSGGGGTLTNETDPIFSTWAQANSASYTSTYTTVNTNSASWSAGGSGSGGLSGISYNRWAFTGSPPVSSFSLSGATSDTEEAYRVTVDFLLQDPLSYTVSNETITFTEAPPLSSSIVVIESYATAGDTYQPLDAQLTDLAGLSYTGNALKVLRVNAGETGLELAAPAGGGDAQITVNINGGGAAITTGLKGFLRVPYACTITAAELIGDQTGSIVIDIWKSDYASLPAVDAGSITASAPPTLSSALKSTDATLAGWTTSLAAGDYLAFNVDSAATVEQVTLSLTITRTI